MAVNNKGLRLSPYSPEEDQRFVDLEAAFAGTGIAGPAADVAAMTGTIISGFTASSAGTLAPAIATAGGSTPTATQVDTAVNAAITNLNQLISNDGAKINAILAAIKAAGIMV